jgi:hypothetical protein
MSAGGRVTRNGGAPLFFLAGSHHPLRLSDRKYPANTSHLALR